MTFEELQKANATIMTTGIERKDKDGNKSVKEYAEVNQRIKAFRMLFPEGFIKTELKKLEDGFCLITATVGYYEKQPFPVAIESKTPITIEIVLGTGTAYEKENSTFINKTSYIENCETSAVGRALAMCGIGIDTSVASAEEVQNAINNQDITIDEAKGFVFNTGKYKGQTIEEINDSDPKYLQWWLDNGKDYRIKQMITLITGMQPTEIPSEEEQQDRFELMNDLVGLAELTNTDYEKILKHYGVESNVDMTTEQLKEAVERLKEKLV